MSDIDRTISFRDREFKGSRLRCLLLTSREPKEVAEFLSALVFPYAEVNSTEQWAPRGFREPDEAKLGETDGFLSDEHRKSITNWWLAKSGGANTPNWDLVSSCRMGDRQGLILVEAKAHEGEMVNDRCGSKNKENFNRIKDALNEATNAWNEMLPGFALSADSHYQLSNRFAFAWKIAKLGIPVVLVYLGFLDANEMTTPSRILLNSDQQWRTCILEKSSGLVPKEVWNKNFDLNGTPLTILLRSAVVTIASDVIGNKDDIKQKGHK
jgi:hypothetical protein